MKCGGYRRNEGHQLRGEVLEIYRASCHLSGRNSVCLKLQDHSADCNDRDKKARTPGFAYNIGGVSEMRSYEADLLISLR